MKNVETISSDNKSIFINTVDSLFIISKNGKFKSKKSANNQYSVYDNSESFTLEKNIIKDKTGKTTIDLSKSILKDKKSAKYLAKSKDAFFTCILDSQNMSYSNNIVKLYDSEKFTMFCYLVGEPAGLYSVDNKLWYLYNKSIENANGILRVYDLETGELISEDEIPVIHPVGLFVLDNQIYTYSNYSSASC